MPIVFKSAHRFIIIYEVGGIAFKLFQIMFSKKDGSLHVNFPYYKHQTGLVTLVRFVGEPDSVNLGKGGKVTSHRVKYSHHVDGRAHFSQDGRVRSSMRKMAVPLKNLKGQVFTIQLQGLDDFAKWDQKIKSGPNAPTYVRLDGGPERPPALKFIGWWHPMSEIVPPEPTATVGPIVTYQINDKLHGARLATGVLLVPLPESPNQGAALVLTCEMRPQITESGPSILSFMGGFDAPEIVNDLSQETSFLSLIYPVPEDKYLNLSERIGSIDFVR